MTIHGAPACGYDYGGNRTRPVRVDAEGRLIIDLGATSVFDLKAEIQRFAHRAVWAYYGIDFTWATYGTKIPAGTEVTPLSIVGACALYQIQFHTRCETNKVRAWVEMDGYRQFSWWSCPDFWQRMLDTTTPSTPLRMGASTLVRYDLTNYKFIFVFEPHLLQDGACKEGTLVKIINNDSIDREACIHILYGLPTSIIARIETKSPINPEKVRKALADKLGIPEKRLTIVCGYGSIKEDVLSHFVEMSAPDECVDADKVLEAILGDMGVL